MFELFSDIFACRDNALRWIDPRVKILLAMLFILGVLLSSTIYFPLVIFGFALITTIALRIPLSITLARLIPPLGIVGVIVILKMFMVGSSKIFTISFAGIRLIGYLEGLEEGMLIGSRVLGAVSVMMLLSFVSPAHEIFRALAWFRVPRDLIEIATLMYRYTFILVEQVSDVAVAQRVRLGYAGMRRTLSSAGMLAGTVIVRSMDQSMRTHEAMVSRCYEGHIPLGPMPRMKSSDWLVLSVCSLLAGVGYILLGRGWL